MASVQERLNRMKQDGLAAAGSRPGQGTPTLQQRLERMRQDGAAGGKAKPSAQPAASAGSPGLAAPARGMPEWLSTPSFGPLPGTRSSRAVREEMDGMDKAMGALRERRDGLNAQAQALDSHTQAMKRRAGAYADAVTGRGAAAQSAQLRRQAQELEKELARLEQGKAGLQAEWGRADAREFEQLRRTPEFRAAVDKAMDGVSGLPEVTSPYSKYADVSRAMRYFQAKARGDEQWAQAARQNADMALDKMDEGQRDRLAYYVGTGDYDGALDYLNRIMPGLNQAAAEEVGQGMAQWAQQHPVLGAATNVVSWPMNIPAYFDNARQGMENLITGEERQSPRLNAYVGPKIGSGAAQGTQEAVRSAAAQATGSERMGDAAAFLTGTALSIGQNATQIALLGPGSLPAMAMSAAGSSTAEALDRGAAPGEALAVGTAAGAIETITEKLPLDNLFRLAKEGGGQGLKETVKSVLKQMGTEATEEAISEIANNVADTAVMGDRSEFQGYVRELQAAGLPLKEAQRQAFTQFYFLNTLASAAGGAISGGVMSGGAMALNRLGGRGAQSTAAESALEEAAQGAAPDSDTAAEGQAAQGKDAGEAGRENPLKGLADTAQTLRETYARGEITDEGFDQAMDRLQEQAELMGLEMSQALKLLDGGTDYRTEGAADHGEGTREAGEQLFDRDGGRLPGAGAGREAASVGESGPQGPADAGGGTGYRGDPGQPVRTETVSSRDLGLAGGTDAKTVRVLPEDAWNGELRTIARKVHRETGLPVRFTLGPMETMREDGQARRVRGVYNESGITIQADNRTATAAQIADHEIFHSYAQSDPGLVQAAEDAIIERYGREALRDVLATYAKNLRGIADVSELDTMDSQSVTDLKNEVLADAFAGINAFGVQASNYQEAVYDTLESRGTATPRGRENAQAMDSRTGPPEAHSIEYDRDNRPFVTVKEDILAGVPRENWVKTVKDSLRKKFPNGVTVGNREIKIDRQSIGEMTFSRYTQRLMKTNPELFADKLRALPNADELLQASRGWVNEGLNHLRKDNIQEFARGIVQLRIGENDYTANVVVASKKNGDMLLYDLLNLKPAEIKEKAGHSKVIIVNPQSETDSQAMSSKDSITQGGDAVKAWDGTLPRGTDTGFTLPGGEAGGGERYSAQPDQDGVMLPGNGVPDGRTLPTLAEKQAMRAKAGQGKGQAGEFAGEQAGEGLETQQQAEKGEFAPKTVQEAAEAYKKLKAAQRTYGKVRARNKLTQHDEIQVGRLLRGELELEHLDPAKDNVRGITEVLGAKREYEEMAGQIHAWNKRRKAQLRAEADGFLETASQWKDKKAGILYSRETMERNIRDIVPDRDLAERINKRYFQPVHQAAAAANKMKNEYRDRVRALGLSRKAAKGDAVSESYAVQLLGEAEDNIRLLQESQGKMEKRDGKTIQEWQAAIGELWKNSPSLDQKKIRGAVEEFRAIYDELFQQMNETRVRNGYEPVSYRQGYFPHFQADSEGLMAQFGKALGIDTAVTNLPTTINGLTHTFKPGIQYFGNALERKGFDTAYDAVQGFDRYIEGVADVIHQTDNIQALRALAAQARYRTGDEGLRQQIKRIQESEELTDQEKQTLVDDIYKNGRFALSNFVVELDEYTNLLANKKSRADRNMEQALGRRMYNIVKGLESRVAANMVAVNPASWLTNVVPLTQGWGAVKGRYMLEGMWDTLKAVKEDDGMVGMSSFLTNRRGSDPIVRTWQQSASAKLSQPMEWIDCFTADSLVRARFKQNQAAGLSEAASIEEADAWAAGVMADRSKGSTPTLFNRSNPLTKVFTQFQLEVNNQLSYLFKDIPREGKDKGLAALAAMLFKLFLGAYLYNETYEALVGRRCALDPIGILNDSVGDFTGYQIPNLWGMVGDAAQGKEISFKTEKKKPYEAAAALGVSLAEELPFVGGPLGGGRLPVSSAWPDVKNLGKAVLNDQWDGKKRAATALKAMSGPAAYLALPFGGGQVKKIYQGLKTVLEGGSYTVDNEGRDILQYPVFNETFEDGLLTLPTALTFGKSSLPTAREWAERGFKSMSAKETTCYQGMVGLDVPQRDAYALLRAIGDVEAPAGEDVAATEKAAYQKRKLLREAGISEEGKGVVYYTLLASDREREVMDALENKGEGARVLMALKDAGAELKGQELSAGKKKAIAGSALGEEEKDAIFRYVLGKDSKGAAWSEKLAGAGLDGRSAAAVANALNALTPEQGKKTVSDAQKWRAVLDTARGAENQKAALLTVMEDSARTRFEIAAEYGITPEAWVRLKEAVPQFDADGNGSYSGKEVRRAIDALGGDGSLLAPWDKAPVRLSREEKAVLWQLFTGNKSGGGNPYSTRVGKKVAGELEEAREKRKEKEG